MSKYSSYFNFSSDPTLSRKAFGPQHNGWMGNFSGHDFQDVVKGGGKDTKAAKAFDKLMSGHDETTAKYTGMLKSIYDGYGKYVKEYEGNIQPIIEALNGDIEVMGGYVENYDQLLNDNKDTFLNGIVLDPNSNRTRSEYVGGVANEYENARETQNRNMVSQGLNPFANKGADRQLRMNEAKDKGLAHGMAYSDWRENFNRDKQSQQNAVGQFIGLQGKGIEGQSAIMNARQGVGDFHGSIMKNKISADEMKAKGYDNLRGIAEDRRQEALSLGQQQQENRQRTSDITQQLNAKRKHGGVRYGSYSVGG